MKKLFRNIALFAATAVAAVGCAPEQGEIIDTIELNRALTPLEFKASVIASKGTDVEFSWEAMEGTEKYTLQLFAAAEDAEGNTVAPNYDEASPIETYIVLPEEIPFVVENLPVDESFYARVRGHKTNVEDSHWAVLEKDFSTYPVRSNLYPKAIERGTDYIVIEWDAAEDKVDLTSVRVAPVMGGEEKVVALESADKNACSKKVEGLEACTNYRIELIYGKAGSRGITTAWTRPSIGEATAVATAEALTAAITGATGDLVLKVAYNDGVPYELTTAFETLAYSLTIYGEPTGDGKKPIINNLEIRPKVAVEKIHIQDVVLDGINIAGFVVDNKGAKIGELAIVNCELTGYTKGVLYGSGGATSGADEIKIEGCYVHDLNGELADNGNAIGGGDLLDFRNGEYKNFNIVNNTWSYSGRSFLRIDIATENVVVANNTFNSVGVAANTNGIFYVTKVAPTASFVSSKNVFMNMNSSMDAVVAKVGLGKNGSGGFAPKFDNCYFYNTVEIKNDKGEVTYNYFNGSKYTAWGAETTFGEAEALAEGGKMLTEDPCVNSAGAKFYLNTTSDISAKKVGDPRWWNAQQPVIVRATELTLESEPRVWDFTVKSKFDTESLVKPTIIDNVRIYGTAEVPAEVVMGEGVKFSKGAMVNAEGEPEYSAVGVLTEGYGAIVVTAQGETGIETMQVLAGGDRYTILADGEPHKVVLGDLAGENNIYVLASSAVTLTKVEWTKDLTPDQTVFPLAKPVITLSATSLDEGTAEAVTVSWAAVENADKYVLTGLGQTLTFTADQPLELTVPADQVAAMAVGEYEITLTAYPVETSTKYSVSDTATATFKIKKVVLGGEVTLTWDFTSDAWAATRTAIGTANNTTYEGVTDGLKLVAGDGSIKVDSDNGIRLGGAGSISKRCFSFEAVASGTVTVWGSGTGTDAPSGRSVVCQVGESGEPTKVEVTTPKSEYTECKFEITANAGDIVYVYTDQSLNLYKIEYTYVAAPVEHNLTWAAEALNDIWKNGCAGDTGNIDAAFVTTKMVAGGNLSIDADGFTYDGLQFLLGGGKFKFGENKNAAGETVARVQFGGSGNTGKQVLIFEAPAAGVLKVEAVSSGDTSRPLKVVVDSTEVASFDTPDKTQAPAIFEVDCTTAVAGSKIYIYSGNSGINLFSINYSYVK